MLTKDPEDPPVVLKRHPTLYMDDGSIIIRTERQSAGIVYNLYRGLLANKSGFFAGLFDLPLVVDPGQCAPPAGTGYKTLKEIAEARGLDGLTDATALVLPDKVEADDLDHLFEFIFNMKSYGADEIRPLLSLCAILKLSHFFDVETGMQHAIYYLSTHPHLSAPLRLYLACTYDVDEWISKAFKKLMKIPIETLSANDEALIGSWAYKLLVRTHAKVDQHRHALAFGPPLVKHEVDCYAHLQCERAWADAWFGRAGGSGMVSALLHTKTPGSVLYSTMGKFQVPGMRDVCRVSTLSSLEDTQEKKSGLKKEEVYIEQAIMELKAHI
ncbi:hypothetical protein DFH07DRAFT_784807 [Mycena maculata]|uniref:BTB domain-containing protein n=1 Tax=Mycena maculata TaxID=230809 RepID=A0AAD7HFW6_9AGAR|nr:hypothetical protein DFH07DRAFT_784807 [Mycena maculata]